MILISNLQKGYPITLATSGLHWEHAWGKRATIPYVFSLQGKKIKLEDGTSYLGSYWKQGYSIDMMLNKEGIPYIERNVYESWANSQYYKGIIDTKLPVDRFDIDTGEEGSFKEYNDEVHQVREKREAYCRKVIRQARKQFNISEEQAKILLKFAGTANILSLATRFEREGLTTEQALVMLRKNSHAGMESVLAKAGIEYPENKHFDDIQDAARTVAYIHTLQGEKSGPYTVAQIRKVINPRQGEMNSVLNETIKGARTPNSKDKTKNAVKM